MLSGDRVCTPTRRISWPLSPELFSGPLQEAGMDWIQGHELLDPPYNLHKIDVFKAVQEGRLVPFSESGQQIFPTHKDKNKEYYLSLFKSDLKRTPKQQEELMEILLDSYYSENQVVSIAEKAPFPLGPPASPSLSYFASSSSSLSPSFNQSLSPVKKLKPKKQKIREEVRKKAQELWEKDPTITIADMAYKFLVDIAKKPNGGVYSESTLKKWIKDLCPNRKPGRRPKK
jgi:hypothetical protein